MPIAMKEMRIGPFRRRSYIVCEHIDGIDALDYFLNSEFEDKKDLSQQIIKMFRRLKLSMARHGDMKASNILIHHDSPYLIDLDSMVIHKNKQFFTKAHRKDIARFMKNWAGEPRIANLFRSLNNQNGKQSMSIR